MEEWVLHVEGLAVHEQQVLVPLPGRVETRDEARDQRDERVDPSGVRAHGVLESAHDLVFGLEGEVAGAEPVGQEQVRPHQREEDETEDEPEADLDQEQRREDAAEAGLGEPHLVGPEHRQAAQRQEAHEHHRDGEPDPESARQSPESSRTRWHIGGATHDGSLGRFSDRYDGARAARVQGRIL